MPSCGLHWTVPGQKAMTHFHCRLMMTQLFAHIPARVLEAQADCKLFNRWPCVSCMTVYEKSGQLINVIMKTNTRGTECYAPCSFKYSDFLRVVQNVLLDWLQSSGEAVDILHYATSDELASEARLKTAVELLLSCLYKCIISSFHNKGGHDRFLFN